MGQASHKPIELSDQLAGTDNFLEEVLRGLSLSPKSVPSKYFYDERGSILFDKICGLDEYYPTRTEIGIMRKNSREMAESLGPGCAIIEFGSGSGIKIRLLLEHLMEPAAYVPVDISREHLLRASEELAKDFPGIHVLPVCADFTASFELPPLTGPAPLKAVYFPGSTIGNFVPGEARAFLRRTARICGEGGGLLIGVDLVKDTGVLEAAYNDRKGITREFNLNILNNINRELGGDFRLDRFRHRAFFNSAHSRIEMHLESLEAQTVTLNEHEIHFTRGETIHTENSYKYSLSGFADLAEEGGFTVQRVWTDEDRLFSVQYLTAKPG